MKSCRPSTQNEMIRDYASTNSFLGQEGPGFLKLGPVSVGALANGEEFGVVFAFALSPDSLTDLGKVGRNNDCGPCIADDWKNPHTKCGSGIPFTLVGSTFPVGVARYWPNSPLST